MPVPFNDLSRRPPAGPSAARVWERGIYLLGPELEAFEREFAAYCGASHGVGVANGTDALELALRAVGVGAGDEVACAANAGMYATTAIRAAGGIPRYVDVDPCRAVLSTAALKEGLGPATRAVIVTHLYGRMAPMAEILAIAGAHAVPVIEDCAQAHGATLDGRKAGAWGVAAAFSFYPTKNLGACGDAGAVVTSDPDIAEHVRSLRQYGWTAKYESTLPGGRNSRLDEVQAAILRDRLPLLDSCNERRREIARRYSVALAGRVAAPAPPGADDVVHLYVIRTPRRDDLRAFLASRGVRAEIHYPVPDHLQASQRSLPTCHGPLPETERLAQEVLSLPCFPEMADSEVGDVIDAVMAWI